MKKKLKIDEHYFKKYAGSGQSYEKVYRDHNEIDSLFTLFEEDDAPKIKRILVLGTGTGLILKDFHQYFGIYPYGCEISEYAYSKIPLKFRKRIKNQDMRIFLNDLQKNKKTFDLTFSNSLIYLEPEEISKVSKKIAKLTKFLHFDSSFLGHHCKDPYRKTLRSYEWWNQKFKLAGLEECRTIFGSRTYLWKSKYLN